MHSVFDYFMIIFIDFNVDNSIQVKRFIKTIFKKLFWARAHKEKQLKILAKEAFKIRFRSIVLIFRAGEFSDS